MLKYHRFEIHYLRMHSLLLAITLKFSRKYLLNIESSLHKVTVNILPFETNKDDGVKSSCRSTVERLSPRIRDNTCLSRDH